MDVAITEFGLFASSLSLIFSHLICNFFRIGYAGEFVPRSIIRTEILDANGEPLKICSPELSEKDLLHRLVRFFRYIFFK